MTCRTASSTLRGRKPFVQNRLGGGHWLVQRLPAVSRGTPFANGEQRPAQSSYFAQRKGCAVPNLSAPRRPAFTLIELLVVIAITSILIGLLLPAVQQVREAAARSQCQNNLKQMGLACHAYHDAKGRLPPGYTATAAYPATSPGWGWGAYLLPYLEQQNLYQQIDFTKPVEAQAAIQTIITVYLCPSDIPPTGPFTITDATFGTVGMAAPSSYAATCGDDSSDVDDATGNGVFYRNSKTRLIDITDGTSNTTLIGERAWVNVQGIWAGSPNNAITRPGPMNAWQSTSAPAPCLVLAHNNWINITTDADGGLDDFSSQHPGGANLLFGDGSVRFIRSITTDYNGPLHLAYMAMGTREAGDMTGGLE
jgi:prepilin-type N-terminal cleavage/methylation domain-containing protein/prepilin-type processing-associated H-X9-DG protein